MPCILTISCCTHLIHCTYCIYSFFLKLSTLNLFAALFRFLESYSMHLLLRWTQLWEFDECTDLWLPSSTQPFSQLLFKLCPAYLCMRTIETRLIVICYIHSAKAKRFSSSINSSVLYNRQRNKAIYFQFDLCLAPPIPESSWTTPIISLVSVGCYKEDAFYKVIKIICSTSCHLYQFYEPLAPHLSSSLPVTLFGLLELKGWCQPFFKGLLCSLLESRRTVLCCKVVRRPGANHKRARTWI